MTTEEKKQTIKSLTETIQVIEEDLKSALYDIERLESLIARMAHQTGTQNLLKYFNVSEYEPTKDDMQKWQQ
jgi:hypothetical protein